MTNKFESQTKEIMAVLRRSSFLQTKFWRTDPSFQRTHSALTHIHFLKFLPKHCSKILEKKYLAPNALTLSLSIIQKIWYFTENYSESICFLKHFVVNWHYKFSSEWSLRKNGWEEARIVVYFGLMSCRYSVHTPLTITTILLLLFLYRPLVLCTWMNIVHVLCTWN